MSRWAAILAAFSVVAFMTAGTSQALAQTPFGSSGSDGDDPIEIEASDSLEWHSEEKIYVARGDALLRQGDSEVRADILTAYYRELDDETSEIWRMTADGNVIVEAPDRRATGDHGVYDVDRNVFVLTGGDLTFVTPTETVTARDSLEYWNTEQIAVARGDAVAVRETDRIEADVLTAEFVETPEGALQMTMINGVGNVVITTETDVASADEGFYNVGENLATLSGTVRLNRDDSQLNGEYAEFDLDTGVSRLLTRPGSDGRVHGLLVPSE